MLLQRLHAQVHLVGLQVERARACPHRLQSLLGRVAVLAQALELLATRPHRVDLILVVVAQRLEDAVQPLVLLLDHHLETGQRRALRLQAAPARRRRGPLLGVALQTTLHLGLALRQHAPTFDHARHPHLDLLAPAPEPRPPLLEGLPGLQRLLQLGERPGQVGLLGRDVGQPLLPRHDGGAGLLELGGNPAPLFGGALPVGPAASRMRRHGGRWPARLRSAHRGSGRAQCGSPRGGRGPARRRRQPPRPRRRASSTEAAVTTLVAERTRQPVAAKRSPSGVTTTRSSRARERSMASSHPSTRTARPTRVSSTDSAAAPPWRTRTWRRTASALLPGGQRPDADRTRRLPRREDGAGDTAFTQGGQGGLRRATPVDHHRRDPRADGGLEGGVPPVVDLHQVDQRTHHAVDVAQQLAPAGALQVRQRALQRLGAGRSAVPRLLGLVRRHLGRLRRADGLLELGAACRQLRFERSRRLFQLVGLLGQEVGAHRRTRRPLLQGVHPRRQRVQVLLLARRGAADRFGAGADPGNGLIRRIAAEHRGPALLQSRRLPVEGGQRLIELRPFRGPAGLLVGLGRDQLAGQAGRLGLEGGDHVDVGRGIEGGHHAAPARAARR